MILHQEWAKDEPNHHMHVLRVLSAGTYRQNSLIYNIYTKTTNEPNDECLEKLPERADPKVSNIS